MAALLAVSAQCCLSASPASADVLEIGNNGATWIAGGPYDELRPAGRSGAVQGLAGPASPLTLVANHAGPAVWRGHVAHLAAKYDISPELLEAVVWQESRWNPNAVSRAGARGLAQLMPGTARQLGVNAWDSAANLEGGAKFLRAQLDTFNGDVELALAAYNSGPERVKRLGRIPRIAETQSYVAAILGRLNSYTRR